MRHNAQSPCAEKREVHDGITLLTETSELVPLTYAIASGDGIANIKEYRLTNKREKDYVVRNKDEIEPAFSISRVCRVIRW